MKNAYKILMGSLQGRDNFEDLGMNDRIILNVSWRKRVGL
jgi:hypothetical protein